MRSAEFLKRCLEAGLSVEAATLALKAFDAEVPNIVAETLENVRAKGRARQAKLRARNVTSRDKRYAEPVAKVTSRDVTSASVTSPLARVEDKTLIPRIVDKTDADDSACANDDWPKGDARQLAQELVQAAGTSRLDPARSPGLATTLGRLPMWKASGASWLFDVVPTVTAVAQKAKGPIGTWGYFDNAIAQSVADNRKALEIPEARMSMGQGPPSFVDQQLAIKSEARRRALAEEKPDGLPN